MTRVLPEPAPARTRSGPVVVSDCLALGIRQISEQIHSRLHFLENLEHPAALGLGLELGRAGFPRR